MNTNKPPRRGRISDKFEKRLKDKLIPLISYVASQENLDLQVRDNYFNIYFNGGNALRVTSTRFSFDPWYFYDGYYKGIKIPKTYVEECRKGKQTQRKSMPKNYPSAEVSNAIFEDISQKATGLTKLVETGKFDEYFQIANSVVGSWVEKYGRKERKNQHLIACSNRKFSNLNNLVVIDIEFAVSTNKSYNNSKKVPKMDIIAVDKHGQLYSIELKNTLQADKEGSAQDVKSHLSDFNLTIGSKDTSNDFPTEMAEVLAVKQRLGLLDETIRVDTSRKPLFAVAFSGNDSKELEEFKQKHSDLIFVDIVRTDNEKNLFLNLH